MPARRLTILVAVLTGLFVLGVALAVGGLLALRDPGVLVVCLVALVAGVLAAGLAYAAARVAAEENQEESAGLTPELPASPVALQLQRMARSPQRPVRIQSLPVADLPAPYLAAVMTGLQASRAGRPPQQCLH